MTESALSTTWLYAAGVRALRTVAQVVVAFIVTNTVIWEFNWTQIIGVSATALVLSLLTSFTGLPEAGSPYMHDSAVGIDNYYDDDDDDDDDNS